jgi:hypothetical protein
MLLGARFLLLKAIQQTKFLCIFNVFLVYRFQCRRFGNYSSEYLLEKYFFIHMFKSFKFMTVPSFFSKFMPVLRGLSRQPGF